MDLPKIHINRLRERFQKLDCPYDIAAKLGIIVVKEDLGNILGYFYKHRNIASIHININLDEHLAKFTCLHELGHSLLHPKLNLPFLNSNTYFPANKFEREANRFAVLFIVSETTPLENESKEEFLTRCGVPHEFQRFY